VYIVFPNQAAQDARPVAPIDLVRPEVAYRKDTGYFYVARLINGAYVWNLESANTSTAGFDLTEGKALVPLTDGTSIASSGLAGNQFILTISDPTLNGQRTLAAPTDLNVGELYTWVIKQGIVADRFIKLDPVFVVPGGKYTPVQSAGRMDVLRGFWDGVNVQVFDIGTPGEVYPAHKRHAERVGSGAEYRDAERLDKSRASERSDGR
jgi:hypothetical protein